MEEMQEEVQASAEGQTSAEVQGEGKKEQQEKKKPGGLRYYLGGLLTGILVTGVTAGAAFTAWNLGLFDGGQSGVVQESAGEEGEESSSAINTDSVYKLQLLENSIDKYYYKSDEVTTQQRENGMYKGLLESLDDPYSTYYTAEEVTELSNKMEGVYYGIGAYLALDNTSQMTTIVGVIPDTPAEKAGLRAGDKIYRIDGESAVGLTTDEVVSQVKGEEGTTVHLTIYREGESDYLEMDIQRAQVNSPTVYSEMLENDIGYLQITEFDKVTVEQFTTALTELKDQGMKGMILDLRSNPGGDVSVVTEIANHILPEGLVFYAVDKNGERKDFTCDGGDELEVPLVVLVNQYSASASEILTGAIQDAGVGTVVGKQTYGKGVMQTIYSLTDGSAVKLTVAGYYTRGGRDINKKGITPDVECDFDTEKYYEDGTDVQLDKAIQVLGEKMGLTVDTDENTDAA